MGKSSNLLFYKFTDIAAFVNHNKFCFLHDSVAAGLEMSSLLVLNIISKKFCVKL